MSALNAAKRFIFSNGQDKDALTVLIQTMPVGFCGPSCWAGWLYKIYKNGGK